MPPALLRGGPVWSHAEFPSQVLRGNGTPLAKGTYVTPYSNNAADRQWKHGRHGRRGTGNPLHGCNGPERGWTE